MSTELAKINAELSSVAGYSRVDEDLVEMPRVPRIFFFTLQGAPNSDFRKAQLKSVPKAEEGDPLLGIDNAFLPVTRKAAIFMFPDLVQQYWAIRDTAKLKVMKFDDKPHRNAEAKTRTDTGWQENVLALLLVLPEDPAIMPIASVCNFIGAKCPFMHTLRDELKRATTKEWATEAKGNAELIGLGIPPAFRIEATLKTFVMKGNDFPYTKATADCRTATKASLARIAAWSKVPEQLQKLEEAKDYFNEELTAARAKK